MVQATTSKRRRKCDRRASAHVLGAFIDSIMSHDNIGEQYDIFSLPTPGNNVTQVPHNRGLLDLQTWWDLWCQCGMDVFRTGLQSEMTSKSPLIASSGIPSVGQLLAFLCHTCEGMSDGLLRDIIIAIVHQCVVALFANMDKYLTNKDVVVLQSKDPQKLMERKELPLHATPIRENSCICVLKAGVSCLCRAAISIQ